MSADRLRYARWALALALVSLLGALALLPLIGGPREDGRARLARVKADKLTARLAQLADPPAMLAPAAVVGRLVEGEDDRILTYVQVSATDGATVEALRAAGAEVVHVAEAYGVITARVAPRDLRAVAALPSVVAVEEALAPELLGAGRRAALEQARAGGCRPTVSEGVTHLRVDEARAAFGVDGSGVTVGLLSDSFDQASGVPGRARDDVLAGELPGPGNPCGRTTPVRVIEFSAERPSKLLDEGRGLAQIVHDVAPGAELLFAATSNGFYAYADAIRALREAGADIIVDDVMYINEPFFQEGPIGVAVSEVVADGAIYLTAAGNNNNRIDGKNYTSYEAPAYRPAPCPTNIQAPDCHDFDPGSRVDVTSDYTVPPRGGIGAILQWAEPWYGVETDLDFYLLDEDGEIVWASENPSLRHQRPVEGASFKTSLDRDSTLSLVIARHEGKGTPRLKYILSDQFETVVAAEYAESRGGDIIGPTIYGHASNPDAITVGATRYLTKEGPEVFSSRGPSTYYFGPVTGERPAPAIGPLVIPKPDIVASNDTINTVFGIPDEEGVLRFTGTSAAAPHAAAVAALLVEAARGRGVELDQEAVRAILMETAHPMPRFGPEARGAGLVDAYAAMEMLLGSR